MDAALAGDLDRALIPGVGVPHDSGAGVVGEHPFELACRLVGAVRNHHHPRMDRSPDAHPAAMVHAHPRRAAGGVEERVEDGPIGDGVRAVQHRLRLAIWRRHRARVQVVAADDDRRLHGATPDELVEAQARTGTLAVAEPADASRQALELDLLARGLDPPHQGGVVGELVDHGTVGDSDVLRVTRKRNPSERALAFAEQRPDVCGHEAGKLERARAPAELRLRAQAVAVVEDLRAMVEEIDHRVDVARHALASAAYIPIRIVEAQLMCVFGANTGGDVAERIVRGRLVGDDVHVEATRGQRGQHLRGIAVQPDRKSALLRLGFDCQPQRVLEVGCANVEIAMVEAALDLLCVGFDADRHPAVEGDGERLSPAHAAQARGQRDRAGQRAAEALARDRGESFIGALEDALGADVDPRPRGHLPVHGQPKGLEPPELIPRRPLGHEQRVGDEHARRPLVRVENADRLTRLDEEGLVALKLPQLANNGVERFPGTRRAAGAAVDHKVCGPLRDLGIEVVHEHPHRAFLRPPTTAQLGSPRCADDARRAHFNGPVTAWAAATTAPLRMRASAAASSGASTRSGPTPAMCLRTTSRTAAVAGAGKRGARKSSARAAATSSTARMLVRLSSTVRSFSAAPQPIDTWSSCMPEVGTESTLAGAARRRFSATSEAAVYWATMRPELTPGSCARKGGKPSERWGSRRRSTRRSAMAPTSAAAMARKSAANASGSP